MSRCFPFPPPGYEKKEGTGHEDLLAKEKHREKKNKKEKKDKEKREGKEKKEKDRSKDKHKEKKDKKDKKKEKNRDKDKTRTSADRPDKQNESRHEGNPGECSRKTDEINHSKFTVELAKRIKDDEKVAASRMVENFSGAVQRSINGSAHATAPVSSEILSSVGISQRRVAEAGRDAVNLASTTQKVGSLVPANVLQKERSSSKELGQTLSCTGQQGNGSRPLPLGKLDGFVRGSEGPYSATGVEVEKHKKKKIDSSPGNTTQRTTNGIARPGKSPSILVHKAVNAIGLSTKIEDEEHNIITNHIFPEQKRVHGMVRQAEHDPNKTMVGKEKKREREADNRKKERHDDKDREQKKKKKDKDKDKEKDKEKVKTREDGEHNNNNNNKHKKHDEPKDGRKNDQIHSLNMKPLTLHSVNPPLSQFSQSVNSVSYHTDENIKKRKEIEMNGFVHESDMRPNKIQRTTPSPHLRVENGRTLELSHIKPACSPMRPGSMNNSTIEGQTPVDNKHMTNVIVEAGLRHQVALSNNMTSEVSLKPHPDVKYLSQIYSVPKMDGWPEYDDQEWLFSYSKIQQKPESKLEADKMPQVWAEALRIGSEDVLALPYVIPF